MTAIFFGTLSALVWGAGDFFGGMASRKSGTYRAVFYGEAVGLVLLLGALLFVRETPTSWENILWGAIAGFCGAFGMLILYYAMSQGRMSIAAPVSALLTALLPVTMGLLTEGFSSPLQLLGFAVALAAIWFVAQEHGQRLGHIRLADLRLPFISGLCFGVYFILIHLSSRETTLWPMIVSRSVGTLTVAVFILLRRESWQANRVAWPFIILNGILDVGGNAFYILAGQNGRLDVAAVLSSLYPGATVLLAWLVLKEKLSNIQKLGVLAALTAIVLITL